MPISYTTSFESNLESLADERTSPVTRSYRPSTESIPVESKLNAPVLIVPTSASWKRPSYHSIAVNSRLRHQQQQHQHGLLSSPGLNPAAAQSSFDSIDTIETSSTEASRLDHVTTSFESSATGDTTTDSTAGETATATGGGTGSNGNRMLSLRGDSGYRSMEAAPTSLSVAPHRHLTKSLATTTLGFSGDDMAVDPLRSADDVNQCQCQSEYQHDEKCERNKPIIFARCTRYGLAKSRSAASAPSASAVPPFAWKSRMGLPFLSRDYSIDERTDAIFREFSRCDPVYDKSNSSRREMRQANFNKRWQQQRHEQRCFSVQHDPAAPANSSDTPLYCSLKE